VFSQGSVGEIEPGAVNSTLDEFIQHFGVSGGGANRDYNLRFTHGFCLAAIS
jgi:hypothetical protein